MKTSLKLLLAASFLSAGFVGTASAVTTADVYLTGSSAYRASVTNALGNLLTATDGGSTPPLVSFADNSSSSANVSNSSSQLFVGYPTAAAVSNGFTQHTQYWFHTDWTGSLAGLAALEFSLNPAPQSGSSHPFLPDTLPTAALVLGSGSGTAVTNPSGGQKLLVGAPSVDHVADGALSDVYQSSAGYNDLSGANVNGSSSEGIVGVVPFVWVAGVDAATYSSGGISAISATQAKQLFVGGLRASQLTGVTTDSALVVPVGRNADSGTRLTTFAETGFNPVGDVVTYPQQYAISTSGTSVVVGLYPAETLFSGTPASLPFTAGQSGYSSGGNEATALKISGTNGTSSTLKRLTVGYIGESDGITVVNGGGKYLTYNGVAYGSLSGSTPIYNRALLDAGIYTLWGYEHLYYTGDTNFNNELDALGLQVKATDAALAGELVANMAVTRGVEGGPIAYHGAPTNP